MNLIVPIIYSIIFISLLLIIVVLFCYYSKKKILELQLNKSNLEQNKNQQL